MGSPSLCLAGEGASGEVFQAEWRGQQVAVKVFQVSALTLPVEYPHRCLCAFPKAIVV